jgi:hypothetical protein
MVIEALQIDARTTMYLGVIIFPTGTVRHRGIVSRFPGRRGMRRGVPCRYLDPPWVRDKGASA